MQSATEEPRSSFFTLILVCIARRRLRILLAALLALLLFGAKLVPGRADLILSRTINAPASLKDFIELPQQELLKQLYARQIEVPASEVDIAARRLYEKLSVITAQSRMAQPQGIIGTRISDEGHTIRTGYLFEDSRSSRSRAFVSKMDASGAEIWRLVSRRTEGWNTGMDVAFGHDGRVFVTGHYSSSLQFEDAENHELPYTRQRGYTALGMFLMSIGNNGQIEWISGESSGKESYGLGLAVNADGDVFAASSFTGSAKYQFNSNKDFLSLVPFKGGDGLAVLKYSSDGRILWGTHVSGNFGVPYAKVQATSDGGCVVAYIFSGRLYARTLEGEVTMGTKRGIFLEREGLAVAKYDGAGQIQWIREGSQVLSLSPTLDESPTWSGCDMLVTTNNKIVVVGNFRRALTAESSKWWRTGLLSPGVGAGLFFLKYDFDGTLGKSGLLCDTDGRVTQGEISGVRDNIVLLGSHCSSDDRVIDLFSTKGSDRLNVGKSYWISCWNLDS